MTLRFGTGLRDDILDAYEVSLGPSPKLLFYTGAPPSGGPDVAPTGTLLMTMTLPSDFMNDATGGVKTLLGTWAATCNAAGTVGYFRITNNAGTTTCVEGSVTASGGGGDMELDNVVVANTQAVTITAYTLTGPNP